MCVKDLKIDKDTPQEVIINHTLIQTGVKEVITLLEKIQNKEIDIKQYLEKGG